MPWGRWLLAVVLVVCASACTKFEIKVDRDPAFDVARKATWDWVPIKLLGPIDQRLPDPYLGKKLVRTVTSVLEAKGYRESPDNPDLWVNYRLLTDTQTDLDADPDLQKRLYEGFFESWYRKPGLGGFMIWEWTPGDAGPEDKGYTPKNKPAQEVVREWISKPWR